LDKSKRIDTTYRLEGDRCERHTDPAKDPGPALTVEGLEEALHKFAEQVDGPARRFQARQRLVEEWFEKNRNNYRAQQELMQQMMMRQHEKEREEGEI
jgi:hypothetical protein